MIKKRLDWAALRLMAPTRSWPGCCPSAANWGQVFQLITVASKRHHICILCRLSYLEHRSSMGQTISLRPAQLHFAGCSSCTKTGSAHYVNTPSCCSNCQAHNRCSCPQEAAASCYICPSALSAQVPACTLSIVWLTSTMLLHCSCLQYLTAAGQHLQVIRRDTGPSAWICLDFQIKLAK